MQKAVLTTLVAAFMATAADAPLQKLGPEWTRVGDEYHRRIEVKGVHSVGGNVANYTLPLQKDEVFVSEVDNDRGFEVGSRKYGHFEVTKDEQGRVAEYTAVLGKMRYFDLNGDGVIDAMYDGKANRPMIFFEGRYVQVEDSKGGINRGPVWAIGRGTQYVFKDDRWITKKPSEN